MVALSRGLPEVIVVNDFARANGGSSVVALASERGLAGRGCHTTLFTAVDGDAAAAVGSRRVSLGQEEIVKDGNRLRAMSNGLHNFSAARAFAAELEGRDPARTIVHVHTYTKALSAAVLATALDRGFPVVLSLHDFFIVCPTGGFFLHGPAKLCEKRPLSLGCVSCNCDRRNYGHKLWRVARTFLQNRVLQLDRRITHYVGVSDFSVRVMQPYLPPAVPVTVVRNPIDCTKLPPAVPDADAPFVFIGRFSHEKGVLLFAEAVREAGVPAVFVGDGELRAEARRLCPQARFTGWLPADEVRGWMRRARALVFPPLWYETLGLVVVEAAANGVPALVASRCAATDFIRDGENGVLFEHGSVAALVAQMQRMNDPATAAALGQRAYDWYWSDPWTLDRHVDDLLALYAGIFQTRNGGLS